MGCAESKHVRYGPIVLSTTGGEVSGDLLLSADFDGVTDISGTLTILGVEGTSPFLDLKIVDAPENDVVFMGDTTDGAFAQANSTGNKKVYIRDFSRYVNYAYTLGGTNPKFTVVLDLYGKG